MEDWQTLKSLQQAVRDLNGCEDKTLTLAKARSLLFQANRELDAGAAAAAAQRRRLAQLRLKRDSVRNLEKYLPVRAEFDEKHGMSGLQATMSLAAVDDAFWARNPDVERSSCTGEKLAILRVEDERRSRIALWTEIKTLDEDMELGQYDILHGEVTTAMDRNQLHDLLHPSSRVDQIVPNMRNLSTAMHDHFSQLAEQFSLEDVYQNEDIEDNGNSCETLDKADGSRLEIGVEDSNTENLQEDNGKRSPQSPRLSSDPEAEEDDNAF